MPSCGAAVDADAGEVHFGVFGGGGLHPFDAVGEAGVFEVFVGDLVEVAAAMVSAEAIDLDDDEAAFGHFGFVAGPAPPFFGDEGAVGSGVDVFDNGVFFAFLEVEGTEDDAVDVVLAVAVFGDEAFGLLPADGLEGGEVGFVEGGDEFLVGRPADFEDGWVVNAGPFCEVVFFVRGEGEFVGAVAFGEEGEFGGVEV